jgi:hypothetical protein
MVTLGHPGQHEVPTLDQRRRQHNVFLRIPAPRSPLAAAGHRRSGPGTASSWWGLASRLVSSGHARRGGTRSRPAAVRSAPWLRSPRHRVAVRLSACGVPVVASCNSHRRCKCREGGQLELSRREYGDPRRRYAWHAGCFAGVPTIPKLEGRRESCCPGTWTSRCQRTPACRLRHRCYWNRIEPRRLWPPHEPASPVRPERRGDGLALAVFSPMHVK